MRGGFSAMMISARGWPSSIKVSGSAKTKVPVKDSITAAMASEWKRVKRFIVGKLVFD